MWLKEQYSLIMLGIKVHIFWFFCMYIFEDLVGKFLAVVREEKHLRTDDILLISSVLEMEVVQQSVSHPPIQKATMKTSSPKKRGNKKGIYTVSFTLDAPEFGFLAVLGSH